MGYILYRLHTKSHKLPVLLPEWNLEDEDELKKKLDTVSQSETVSNDVPIFFR
jgi:hypothetical protein